MKARIMGKLKIIIRPVRKSEKITATRMMEKLIANFSLAKPANSYSSEIEKPLGLS